RSKTSTANQAALAARKAASHGSRALVHIRTASAASNTTNSHLAGRAPRTPASVRRPARRSGSKSMSSPNRWECIANMAPNRNVNQGTCDTWFSQLASTKTSRQTSLERKRLADEQTEREAHVHAAEPEPGSTEDLSPAHGPDAAW